MLSLLVAGLITLPLKSADTWRHVNYGNIPQNEVSFGEQGLKIEVDSSSSPLFYPLEKESLVNQIVVKGELTGLPKIPEGEKEGEGSADDFAVRIGLVSPSESSLSWLQKIFAPRWIRELADVSPDKGVEKVYFFNLAQSLERGFKREHPKSDKLIEEVALQTSVPGPFVFQIALDNAIPTYAVWIQCDGDDSKSKFEVRIKSIELGVTPPQPSSAQ